jgi:hypothetical protein
MSFGEIVFYIFVITIALAGIYRWVTHQTEAEKQDERKLKESLEDEFIYIPESGVKLTLEQAESGHWIENHNAQRIKSKGEIEQYYQGVEIEAENLSNHLKSIGYKSHRLTDEEIDFLERTQIFSKYDDWSCGHCFLYGNSDNRILFPSVRINAKRRESGYSDMQLLF